MLRVVEIFTSIDGEGPRAGFPVLFIRFHGCNLACSYCDSQYACEGDEYVEMSVDQILSRVQKEGLKRITITGGEPLLQEDIKVLLWNLDRHKYDVNVETNGSIDIGPYKHFAKTFFTVDYKCPSSGMNGMMLEEAYLRAGSRDVLKFVVGNMEDLLEMVRFIRQVEPVAQLFVSPVFGQIEPREIVEFVLSRKLYNVRVQLQLHKLIWPVDQRGV